LGDPAPEWPIVDNPAKIAFVATTAQLSLKSADGSRSFTVSAKPNAVWIGNQIFKHPPTVVLFQTLLRVLTDLSDKFQSDGLLATQYRSRGYYRNTQIEFSFSSIVVDFESADNPGSPERLYLLDAVHPKESLLWAPRPQQ
jgi:hypothetical protein